MKVAGNNSSREDLRQARRLDFKMFQGDTFSYEYTAYELELDSEGNQVPFDFTDCKLRGKITDRLRLTGKIFFPRLVVAENVVTVYISELNTRDMLGTYQYDIELIDTANSLKYTFLYGDIEVLESIGDFADTLEVYEEIGIKTSLSLNQFPVLNEKSDANLGTEINMVQQEIATEKQESFFSNIISMVSLAWAKANSETLMTSEITLSRFIPQSGACTFETELNFY